MNRSFRYALIMLSALFNACPEVVARHTQAEARNMRSV